MIGDDLLMAVRRGKGPFRHARTIWRSILRFRMPVFAPIAEVLYAERGARNTVLPLLLKILYREPLLRYRCTSVGRSLQMDGPLPYITGNGTIRIGENVRLSGRNTWNVGFKVSGSASLVIEDGAYVGFGVSISVANFVRIGERALIASDVSIFDNPSHPLDPQKRWDYESFSLDETAPVEIGSNAWIATRVIILPGVTIGENSVVGAGSIVTRSIPPNVLAVGNPARVLRRLDSAFSKDSIGGAHVTEGDSPSAE